jgi:hypothetical protein
VTWQTVANEGDTVYTSNIILSSKQALKVRPGEAGDTECDSSVKSCDAVEDDNAWKIDIYLNFLKYV